jgi:shikimate dehydrogenase
MTRNEGMPRVDINTDTRLCAVIGDPVEHSLSPTLHNAGFRAAGLNYVYLAFQVKDVADALAGMRAFSGFRGLSVTIPHKRTVIDLLDEVEPIARRIGSVNTITNEGGRLVGSSTDGPGTLRALHEAGIALEGKHVLFAGTGGAVRAVAFAMAELSGAASVRILGRTPANVETLVGDLQKKTSCTILGGDLKEDLHEAASQADVLIQGTPLGMYPNRIDHTAIPRDVLEPRHVVFDMVYRPFKTRLLREAEAAGCRTVPGIEMLIHQAVLQFERWTGITAPVVAMRAAVIEALGDAPAAQREGES